MLNIHPCQPLQPGLQVAQGPLLSLQAFLALRCWLSRYLVRKGLEQAGQGSREEVWDFRWVSHATWEGIRCRTE
jgi:hypothetical protein